MKYAIFKPQIFVYTIAGYVSSVGNVTFRRTYLLHCSLLSTECWQYKIACRVLDKGAPIPSKNVGKLVNYFLSIEKS